MKANSIFRLLRIGTVAFLITCCNSISKAQDYVPKNYVGVSGIGELTRLAVGIGAEYERWLYVKDRLAIGAKGQYIFPSKTLNLFFSSNETLQRNSQTQLMATGYLFTSRERKSEGFFISLGLGANMVKWSTEVWEGTNPGHYYTVSKSEILPGFDLSLGAQFDLNGGIASRFTGGFQVFPGAKYDEYIGINGIALLYAKFSIGF